MLGKLSYGIKKVLDLGTFGPQLARGSNQKKKFQRSDETFSINKLLFSENENGMFLDATDVNLNWRKNLLTYSEQFESIAWSKANGVIQTNLLTYSEQFDNAVWTKSSISAFPFDPATATQGSEIVTNGDFSGGTTGWTLGTGWSIGSGVATFIGGTPSYLNWYSGIQVGKFYKFTITVSSITGTSPSLSLYIGQSPSVLSITTAGTYTVYGLSTATVLGFAIRGNATSPDVTIVIDDISVKELTGGLITAPNGTTTADLLVPNTTTTVEHYVDVAAIPFVSGASYTLSVYAKASGYKWLRLAFNSSVTPASERAAWFDVEAGTVGTVQTNVTANIVSVGNGWYRCSISRSATSSVTPAQSGFIQITNANGGTSFTADGTSGMYWWGAQLVQGAVPGDYRATAAKALPILYEFPDSTLTAQVFSATANNATLDRAVVITTGGISHPATNVTVSVWAKRKTGTGTVQLLHPGGGSPLVMDVTNEWKRFEISGTGYSTYFLARIVLSTSGDEIFVSKWQVEYGTVATDYQKITDGVADYYNVDSQPILFQNPTASFPVTAVEQQVGFIIDKSVSKLYDIECGYTSETRLLSVSDFTNTSAYDFTDLGDRIRITRNFNTYTLPILDTGIVTPRQFHLIEFEIVSTDGTINGFYTATNGGAEQAISNSYPGSPFFFRGIVYLSGNGNGRLRFNFAPARSANPGLAVAGDWFEISKKISVKRMYGNHAYQPTTLNSCPYLRARYNLLTYSEQFSNAAWTPSNVSLASGVTDPNGGTSAFTLTATANFGNIVQTGLRTGLFLTSIWMRRRTGSGGVQILSADGATWVSVTVTSQWTKFEDTKTSTNLGGSGVRLSVSGDAVDIAFADLRNLPSPTPYQRIATATDYDFDPTKFPPYLDFDGIDDNLITNTIDLSNSDRLSVFGCVRKTNDTNRTTIIESNVFGSASAGLFSVGTVGGGLPKYYYELTGGSGNNRIPYPTQLELSPWIKQNTSNVEYNMLNWSNDFTQSPWSIFTQGNGVNPIVSSQASNSPLLGTSTALICNANGTLASDRSVLRYAFPTPTPMKQNTWYTTSVWLKSNTATNQNVLILNNFGVDGSELVANVTPSWQRFSLSANSQSLPGSGQLWIGSRGNIANGNSCNILIYGAQFNQGNVAGPYRETTGTPLPTLYEAPDNSITARKFYPDNTSSSGGLYVNMGVVTSSFPVENVMTSFYAKPQGVTTLTGQGGNGEIWSANLSNNVITLDARYPYGGIIPSTNSWSRVYFRTSASNGPNIFVNGAANVDGNTGFLLWGLQREKIDLQPFYRSQTTEYNSETHPRLNTDVISVNYDLTSNSISQQIQPRVDSVIPTLTYGDVETANPGRFSSYNSVFIGKRGLDNTRYFNGRMYSLIVRDRETPDATRFQVEKILAAAASSSTYTEPLFNPVQLFNANTAGVMYDAADIAPQLAWRRNLLSYTEQFDNAYWNKLESIATPFEPASVTLGSELVTNGDFSSGSTGWTTGTGFSISGEQLIASGVTTGLSATNIGTVTAGAWYKVTATVVCTVGSFSINVGGTGTSYGVGTYNFNYNVQAVSSTAISIQQRGSSFTGTVDNLSVKLVTGGGQITAPNNTLTGYKLIKSPNVGNFQDFYFTNLTVGVKNVFSIYAKAAEHRYIYFRESYVQEHTIFDLQTGTTVISGAALVIIDATAVGNGWYRISLLRQTPTVGRINIAAANSVVPSYTNIPAGDGVSGVYIWGAQLEAGERATPYQKIVTPELSIYDYVSLPKFYQDAGTPVFAAEQPVGLMLDKSQGLVLGSEATSGAWLNGYTTTFDTFTSTGPSSFTATTTGAKVPRVRVDAAIPAAGWYVLQFTPTFSNGSFTTSGPAQSGAPYSTSIGITMPTISGAPFKTYFYATGPFASFVLNWNAAGASTLSVSGVSVKSILGNHATQTSTARPFLRSRYNLITYSQDFNNTNWPITGTVTKTQNIADPLGGTSAVRLQFANASIGTRVNSSPLLTNPTIPSGKRVTISLWMRGTVGGESIILMNGWGEIAANTTLTTSWRRYTLTYTNVYSSTGVYVYANIGSPTIEIFGAQIEFGDVAGPYQYVGAATEYDSNPNKFPPYLAFDGVDDRMVIATSAANTLFSNANSGTILVAAGHSAATNKVMFGWTTEAGGNPLLDIRSGSIANVQMSIASKRHTADTVSYADVGAIAANSNFVAVGIANWAANTLTGRLNGQVIETSNYVSAAGNTTAGASYGVRIGGLANVTDGAYYNGRIYGLFAANRAFTDAEIASVEAYYLNSRMPTLSSINYLVDDSGNILVDEFNYNPTVNDITYQ